MILSMLIAGILGILPYVGWGTVFYFTVRKKIKSPLIWILIFTLKLLVIVTIIYLSRSIIIQYIGYFFIGLSITVLLLPFLVNKLLLLLQ